MRAQVHALAGSFEAEDAVYAALRPDVQRAGDDRLQARFLAQEARGLLDRREYARALVRLEEAIGSARDEPAERAALAIDLAATLYHAGQAGRSEEALGDAVAAAAAAGREDLARIARSNRIELWLDRCAFAPAAAEIAELEKSARAEKDRTRLLVALHQRSRLALRQGDLSAASRDNAEARRLAEADRGPARDRGALARGGRPVRVRGRRRGARAARGSGRRQDPPDRCQSDGIARERLAELDAAPDGGTLAAERGRALRAGSFPRGGGRRALVRTLRSARIAGPLRDRAAAVLRGAGAAALAERIADASGARVSEDALRELREVVVARIGGAGIDAAPALGAIGLSRLAVRDGEGRELVRLGGTGDGDEEWRPLEAGSARFALALSPGPPAEVFEAVALLLETLVCTARRRKSRRLMRPRRGGSSAS